MNTNRKHSAILSLILLFTLVSLTIPQSALAKRQVKEYLTLEMRMVGPCAEAMIERGRYQDLERQISNGTVCTVKATVYQNRKIIRWKRGEKKGRKRRRIIRRKAPLKGAQVFFSGFEYRAWEPSTSVLTGWTNNSGAVQFSFPWDNSICTYRAGLTPKVLSTNDVSDFISNIFPEDGCACGCV